MTSGSCPRDFKWINKVGLCIHFSFEGSDPMKSYDDAKEQCKEKNSILISNSVVNKSLQALLQYVKETTNITMAKYDKKYLNIYKCIYNLSFKFFF